jgi:hypothetical protein
VNNATMARASSGDLARAGLVRGQLPLAPSRESTQFTNRAASTQGLPRTNENARFASRTQSASVEHVPFEQQRQSMTQMSQRAATQQSAARSAGGGFNESGARNIGVGGAERGSAGGPGSGGWQRFDPSRAGSANSPAGQGSFAGANRGASSNGAEPESRGASSPQAVRINPSIVQNRNSNSSGRGTSSGASGRGSGGARGGGGGHGGGHR